MKFGGLHKFGFLNNHKRMTTKSKKRRHMSALAVMATLGSESNAHGLAKISTSTTTKRKVLWALLVIIGFTAATLQLSLLVNKFFLYQVVEVSQMKDGMPVEFPSVTICNIATISLTKVNELIPKNDSKIIQWFNFIYDINFGEQDARMDSHQAFYENIPEEARYIGHDINNFVIKCRFNQRDCGPKNFSLFFDGKNYYNCFTFNSGYNEDKGQQNEEKLLMHTTGPQNGLSLVIALDNEESPPGGYGIYDTKNHIAFSAGVRAQVHAPNTMPSPADHGFDVPPGYSSSVGLKAILHSRLGYPHGNCTEAHLEGHDRLYRNTIFSCLQLCKQKILVNNCGCKTAALPMYHETSTRKQNLSFCGSIKNWESKSQSFQNQSKVEIRSLNCEEKVLQNLNNDRSYEKGCGCFQPCMETSYQKSLSLSYWPLEFYQLSAMQEFYPDQDFKTNFMKEAYDKLNTIQKKYEPYAHRGEHVEYNKTDLEDYIRASTLIRQNLLRLNIYLEDLSIIEFAQMPDYDLADLFADVGGTLGLWMGISVLTIMELVELIIRLVMLMFNSEADISGAESDSEEQNEGQTMMDQNNIPHNNKYIDHFQYDRPLYQQSRYDKHGESPI